MSDYDDELVTRSAPRWAWETIDQTLEMDAQSHAFTPELRVEIGSAKLAMQIACEEADDMPISRKRIYLLMSEEGGDE